MCFSVAVSVCACDDGGVDAGGGVCIENMTLLIQFALHGERG